MNPSSIVILSAARTPLGSFQGKLAAVPAPRLGAVAVRAAVARAGIAPERVSDVILGNVLQAGLGQAPARQAALHAGLPPSVRTVTVHKVCGSGLQAIIQGSHWIQSGLGDCVVAGGMENMSAAPYLLPKAREGYRLGHQQVVDSLIHDGLWDPYKQIHMGTCAELCVKKYGFSRAEQDAYAAESFRRANAAQKAGAFAGEIASVSIEDGKGGAVSVDTDEGPARVNYERIPTLKPAFDPAGTITAANASTLNDGAAAVVLMAEAEAAKRGLKPLARIVSFGCAAAAPEWFTTAPIAAARQALERAGWSTGEVDLWEVNEAFAAVPMAFAREMGLGFDRMNLHGGAIALGHPIGASGARIVVTLLSALAGRGRRGLAAICIGGGEALAVCVERIDGA
jgi:acetyl-CoA C-acetyltransferase